MLGLQEPLDCRTGCYTTGVLDLSGKSQHESPWDSPSPSPPHSRNYPNLPMAVQSHRSSPSPASSPTPIAVPSPQLTQPCLTIAQRVLAAAASPNGTRPFNAYPKDPLSLPSTQNESYLQFRQQILKQRSKEVRCPKKRSLSPSQAPSSSGADSDDKDAAYWEKRRKNNEAAKRSRDARRAKEDEIAIRAAFLEQENLRLKYQVAALTQETTRLRCFIYKTEHP